MQWPFPLLSLLLLVAVLAAGVLVGAFNAYTVRRGMATGAFSREWALARSGAFRFVRKHNQAWIRAGVTLATIGSLATLLEPPWAIIGASVALLGTFLLMWVIRARFMCQALDDAQEADPHAGGPVFLLGPFPFSMSRLRSRRERIPAAVTALAGVVAVGALFWAGGRPPPWVIAVPVALILWLTLR